MLLYLDPRPFLSPVCIDLRPDITELTEDWRVRDVVNWPLLNGPPGEVNDESMFGAGSVGR